jgi:hypothetical protein
MNTLVDAPTKEFRGEDRQITLAPAFEESIGAATQIKSPNFIPKQLRNADFRLIKLLKGEKKPLEKGITTTANYGYDDPNLLNHLSNGGNYGVLGGCGDLVIVDFDDMERCRELGIFDLLPKTFAVRSPRRGGEHWYYLIPGLKGFKVYDKELKEPKHPEQYKHLIDVQAENRYVVGPGSKINWKVGPDGELLKDDDAGFSRIEEGYYQVINDVEVAQISEEDLKDRLSQFFRFTSTDKPPRKAGDEDHVPDPRLEEFKRKIDLVKLVEELSEEDLGKSVNLKEMNGYWLGCCPFHNDHDPSLSVHESTAEETGYFKCFSCEDKKGDAITFVEEAKGLKFKKAVAWLAEWAELPNPLKQSLPKRAAMSLERALEVVESLPARMEKDPKVASEPETVDAFLTIKKEAPEKWDAVEESLKGKINFKKMDKAIKSLLKQNESRYFVSEGEICKWKVVDRMLVPDPLCNFSAQIEEYINYNNGAENTSYFSIKITLKDGRPLPKIVVPEKQFLSMSWVNEKWPRGTIVNAGNGVKDHLRAAIQTLSGDIPQRDIFSHLGWRKICNDWVYLHRGGAIGEDGLVDGIEVSFGDTRSALNSYCLPEPPEGDDLREAIKASIGLIDLAPDSVTIPLLGAVYRAPLNEILPADLSIHIEGTTGCFKTEIAALMQAHYGKEFKGTHLPGNWTSTGNALEKQAFLIKDAIFVIDDFVVRSGQDAEARKMRYKADQIFRGQAAQAGRDRLNPDTTPKASYYPRGLILSTGEQLPGGWSLTGRLMILGLNQGDVDPKKLTKAQAQAAKGLFAKSMAGYICKIASEMEELKEFLPKAQNNMRDEILKQGSPAHGRTPGNIASLKVGFINFLDFARVNEAISWDEHEELIKRADLAFEEDAEAQKEHIAGEDWVEVFFEMIRTALVSGKAHVLNAKEEVQEPSENPELWGWQKTTPQDSYYKPGGDMIGWIGEVDLYLHPGSAYNIAKRMAREQGKTLPEDKTLWKRINQRGISLNCDKGRNQSRATIRGHRQRVVQVSASKVMGEYEGDAQ